MFYLFFPENLEPKTLTVSKTPSIKSLENNQPCLGHMYAKVPYHVKIYFDCRLLVVHFDQ